jgi:hypothetical protein
MGGPFLADLSRRSLILQVSEILLHGRSICLGCSPLVRQELGAEAADALATALARQESAPAAEEIAPDLDATRGSGLL